MKSTAAAKIKTEFAKLTPAEQRELLSDLTQAVNTTANPVTELAGFVQKKFGGNLTTEIWTEGASHVPVVYCKFTIPDGTEYTASGKNQKIAKHLAAEQGLVDLKSRE
jgi:dsRNA-specific ribonuclease